jgi:hypothetical protein
MEERCLEGEPLAFVAERSQDPRRVCIVFRIFIERHLQ